MPAKSKAQLRAAAAARGEAWGKEMLAKTKSTKGLPEKVNGKKAKKRKGKRGRRNN